MQYWKVVSNTNQHGPECVVGSSLSNTEQREEYFDFLIMHWLSPHMIRLQLEAY